MADYFKLEAEVGCVRCCQVAITCCLSVDRRYNVKTAVFWNVTPCRLSPPPSYHRLWTMQRMSGTLQWELGPWKNAAFISCFLMYLSPFSTWFPYLLFTLSRFVSKPIFRLPSAAGPYIATSISCITYHFPHLTQFFYHEHEGKRFLRNADKHLSGYRTLHLRLLHSSYTGSFKKVWTSSTLATEVTGPDTLWFFPMGIR